MLAGTQQERYGKHHLKYSNPELVRSLLVKRYSVVCLHRSVFKLLKFNIFRWNPTQPVNQNWQQAPGLPQYLLTYHQPAILPSTLDAHIAGPVKDDVSHQS